MAMIACVECTKEISDTADACPHCGAKVPKPPQPKLWLWIPLGLFAAFMGYGFIASNTPEGKEQAKARDVIKLCREEAKRYAGNAVAEGACRRLENDYRSKYRSSP